MVEEVVYGVPVGTCRYCGYWTVHDDVEEKSSIELEREMDSLLIVIDFAGVSNALKNVTEPLTCSFWRSIALRGAVDMSKWTVAKSMIRRIQCDLSRSCEMAKSHS